MFLLNIFILLLFKLSVFIMKILVKGGYTWHFKTFLLGQKIKDCFLLEIYYLKQPILHVMLADGKNNLESNNNMSRFSFFQHLQSGSLALDDM